MSIKIIANPPYSNTVHYYIDGENAKDIIQCVNWLILYNFISPSEFKEGIIQFNRDKGIPNLEKDPMHYPLVFYNNEKILSISGVEAARQSSPKYSYSKEDPLTKTDALISIVALMGFKVDKDLRERITGPNIKFDKMNPEIVISLKK